MKKLASTICSASLSILGLCAAGSVAAQSTWNLSTSACDPSGSYVGNTAGCTVGGVTATVTGWSTSTYSSASLLQQATLTDQGSSGIGITSQGETAGSPDHAIDSSGKDELVLINFGTDMVSLTGLATGWSYNDTDISVLRWDGGSAGPDLTTMSLTGTNPNTALTSSGWTLLGSADLDGSNGTGGYFNNLSANISNGGSSSWWIITAYYGSNSGSLSKNDDYFKLLSFSGQCTSNIYGGDCGTTNNPGGGGNNVPEPGSLALAAVALAGLGLRRRRNRA